MNHPIDISGIQIQTERLLLRPWKESDLDDFYTYARVDGVGQTTKYGGHPNGEGCRVWAEHLLPVLRRVLEESK